MSTNKHKGRRYIALARCSTNDQAETSLPDQIMLLRSFGDRHEMIYVDKIARDVTGSLPGARTEFKELIQRKVDKDDFDCVLVQDATRLTRSGVQHAYAIKQQLEDVGIDVIYAADHRPEGDYAEVIETVEHIAGKMYSKKLSHAVARGLMSSMEQGRISHTLCIPYGIDRLYTSLDGTPLHIIRNLSDGTQVKLNPDNGETIGTYSVGCRLHHRQQSNERVVLIPGEPERQEVIRLIFRLRLVTGWAGFRIAQELNRLGYRSSKGQLWSVNSIRNILWNSVYTGTGIANRKTFARYSCRSHAEPKQVEVEKRLLRKKKLPVRLRSPSEWIEIDHPHLRNYLGELREAAIAYQTGEWAKQVNPVRKKPGGDRHADSKYILKGLLRSKEGNHPLSGRTSSPRPNEEHRYYTIHKGFTRPSGSNDKYMRRLIPATELEQAVIGHLRDVLLRTPDLGSTIEAAVKGSLQDRGSSTDELNRLTKRKQLLTRQLDVVIDTLSAIGIEAAQDKLRRIEAELKEVSARLDQLKDIEKREIQDPADLAIRIVEKLRALAEQFEALPKAALRRLLSLFVSRLEVEMRTKNVEIEFALPHWAVLADLAERDVRLVAQSENGLGYQANAKDKKIIAVVDCRGVDRRHLRMVTCFDCQRRKAA